MPDSSHGCREGHSPHQALQEVREQGMEVNIDWIVDADGRGCFDNLDQGLVREVIRKRLNDGSIRRLIGKWRHAGVLEGDNITYPEQGTPQGGIVSSLLANIALDGLDALLATHRKVKEYAYTEPNGRQKGSRKWSNRYGCIRYADDLLVTAGTKEDIDAIVPTIETW